MLRTSATCSETHVEKPFAKLVIYGFHSRLCTIQLVLCMCLLSGTSRIPGPGSTPNLVVMTQLQEDGSSDMAMAHRMTRQLH